MSTSVDHLEENTSLVDLVNPLQGTHSHFGFSTGNTLPLIAAPFGMTHWCAQTDENKGGWYFHPDDRKLEGIRATHQPSPWIGDYGHFVLMPQTGALMPGSRERSSAYRPAESTFQPHYFRAHLQRYNCSLQLTPTERCALLRLRFAAAEQDSAPLARRLIIAPGAGEARVEVDVTSQTVRGWTRSNSGGIPDNFRLYFVIRFDVPCTSGGTFMGHKVGTETQAEGDHTGAYVEFEAVTAEQIIQVRVATSFISWEQAELNLQQEIGASDFATLLAQNAARWEEVLGRLRATGGTDEQQRTLYSCLYRTQLFPRQFHEYNAAGQPIHYSPYDGEIHEGLMVTDNGFWDTYRTVYPLYSLLCPDRLSQILEGWLAAYRESDWLPTWASPGHRLCMVGTHADAVFADAIAKGISGFDYAEAYQALRKHSFKVVSDDTGFGRLGLGEYLKLGWVPDDIIHHASVSRTVDYAYDDFCVGQVARLIGENQDADVLEKRALFWRHVFDENVGMLRGRNTDGSWREPWNEFEWGGPYVEGGTWQHTWAVPHDPAGLIDAHGGAEKFATKLEKMLTMPPHFGAGSYGFEIHEMTEMAAADFGQYAHSNQPVHHALYLFACAGRPDLTQYWVRRVLTELYSPHGFAGDEDNGEMSAWFVLSGALGLYPLCPGHPTYVFGSPLFEETKLQLPAGKTLSIRTETPAGLSVGECPYVAEVTWNGATWPKLWISHQELLEGGELRFQLSPTPPEAKEFSPEQLPFSLTPYATSLTPYATTK